MTKFVRILRPCKTKLEKVIINLQSQLSYLFLEWSWMQEKSENAEMRFENNLWTSAGRKLASQAHSAWPSRLVLQCRVCVCYSHRRRAVHLTLLRWQPIRVTAWSWLSVLGASGTADLTEDLLSSDWLPTLTAGTWFYRLYKKVPKSLKPVSDITNTRLMAHFSGTTRVSRCRKVKPIWILLKQETLSGSGISWAICKSALCSRQITMPAPHHLVFTGRMPFLPPNQQRQSTESMCAAVASSNRLQQTRQKCTRQAMSTIGKHSETSLRFITNCKLKKCC